MAPPRKYSVELQQRATRMALDARKDPETSRGAIRRVADQLEVHPEALHNWVRHAEVDDGLRPGITTDDQARITELEREVRGGGGGSSDVRPGTRTPSTNAASGAAITNTNAAKPHAPHHT